MEKPDFTQSVETRRIYSLLEDLEVGDVLSYETIEKDIEKPITECAGAIQTARRALMRDHGRYVATIRGHGLKRVQGTEVVDAAEKQLGSIHRTSRRTAKILSCVDVDLETLSNDDRARVNRVASVAGALHLMTSRSRQKKIQEKFREVQKELPLKKTLDLFQNGSP